MCVYVCVLKIFTTEKRTNNHKQHKRTPNPQEGENLADVGEAGRIQQREGKGEHNKTRKGTVYIFQYTQAHR